MRRNLLEYGGIGRKRKQNQPREPDGSPGLVSVITKIEVGY